MAILASPPLAEQPQPDRVRLLAVLDSAERERARAWHQVNEVQRVSFRSHRTRQRALYMAMFLAMSAEAAYYLALLNAEGIPE